MKKQLLIIALLAAIALSPAIKPAAAAPHIQSTQFLAPAFSGIDPYYETSVIAYETGSTAKMLIRVHNDYAVSSDISVSVLMDWMTANVTSDEVTVEGNEFYVFQLSITIPETSVASNLYLHSYVIYFEYTTNTAPPMIINVQDGSGDNFAVYSADQGDIADIKRQLNAIDGYSGMYVTANARQLLINARTEESLGALMYENGDFAGSDAHYTNALNYTLTGIQTDIAKMTLIEDSVLGVMDSMKGSMSMMGYGSLLFGIGFLFIGIGVIIYSIRRPRSPA